MTALRVLAEASAAGVGLQVDGGRLRLNAKEAPSPGLLERLRAHKAEVVELLTARLCRHCGEPVEWRAPGPVAFADGTAAHLPCYERAEVERLLAAARRVVAGAISTTDEGEILTAEEAPQRPASGEQENALARARAAEPSSPGARPGGSWRLCGGQRP